MELTLSRETLCFERLALSQREQVSVEGEATLPGSMRDAVTVLSVQAQAYLEKAEAVAGGVMLKGHVSFQALYTQGDLTRIRAMETTCDFEHSIEAQEATPDMRVNASVAVQETEGTAVSGRMTLRALLDIQAEAFETTRQELVTDAAGEFVSFRFLGKGNIFGIPTQIVIYVVLILLCMWILHRTKYGERLFLIGVNPQAAEYSGVNTRATIMSTYVLSAVSAAIAGTLLTANVNSAKYDLGSGYTLAIITAVVLGGTLNTGGKGSIIGTVLASLIICILRYGLPLCFGVSTQNLDLPIGLILVVVVLGREIAGQHMLSHLFKRRRKE